MDACAYDSCSNPPTSSNPPGLCTTSLGGDHPPPCGEGQQHPRAGASGSEAPTPPSCTVCLSLQDQSRESTGAPGQRREQP